MQAVILAGGKGTRLAPYTTVLPKPLMPVADRPILEIILEQLRDAGFTQIEMATGHLAELIEAYFGDGSRWGVRIRYHRERDRAGTAGPLALLEDALDDVFLIMNGDVLTDMNFRELYQSHVASECALTIATCARSIRLSLGAIVRDDSGSVKDYIEKPTYEFECSAGIYVANRSVVARVPRGRPYDLPELVLDLIRARERLQAYRIDGYWLDIGTPEDYAKANERFSSDSS